MPPPAPMRCQKRGSILEVFVMLVYNAPVAPVSFLQIVIGTIPNPRAPQSFQMGIAVKLGMRMRGFFQLHRTIFDHPIWTKEQFTWAQAWVDLIGNANFKPNSFFIKDTEIHLDRGQIAWSQITMCDRWQWSRGRVRRFLSYLEKEGMAVQQTGHLTTILTICNYNKYQDPEVDVSTTDSTSDGTTGEHLTDISRTQLNKVNNEKKEKNGKEILFEEFWQAYPKFRRTQKKTALKKWMHIDSDLHQEIVNHVKSRSHNDFEWTKEDGKYAPGPVPFLNGERWNDEWQQGEFKKRVSPLVAKIRAREGLDA